MLKVLKFGGTSMGSAANMKAAAEIVVNEGATVTVLSAMSGTTDALVRIAALAANNDLESSRAVVHELSALTVKYETCVRGLFEGWELASAQETIKEVFGVISREASLFRSGVSDKAIIAQGELLTSAIFARYMASLGHNAVLVNAPDFVRCNGEARVDRQRLKESMVGLDEGIYYITQGFICSDPEGNLSNLGRGGSDYTAALIGAAAGAAEVQIWTDIDGMHNNDPRVVEGTFPIRNMHFEEAAELAYFGAKILHPSTIQPCKEAGIPVLIKNTMQPDAPGTHISNDENRDANYRAVAAKDGITVVRIYSARMLMAYGFLRRVFEIFEQNHTPIDMITTSEVAVSLTVDDAGRLAEIVPELEKLGRIETEECNSIVCIVGCLDHDQSGRAHEIMAAAGDIPIKMISYGASHRSLSLLVETRYKKKLMENLNEKLFARYAEQGN